MKKSFTVVQAAEMQMSPMFQNILFQSGGERQVLGATSPRPVVVHEMTDQITFVSKGRGIARLNGEWIALSEGDVVMIGKGTSHAFICASNSQDLELLHVHHPAENVDNDRIILTETLDELEAACL